VAVWNARLGVPFAMLALTVLLTAAYMFRVVFLAFFGDREPGGHPHDPPAVMAVPLWILAILTVAIGVRGALTGEGGDSAPRWLTALSLALAAAGIGVALVTYELRLVSPAALARALGPLDSMARRRYGLDAVAAAVYRGLVLGLSRLIGWVDRYLVDGVVNVLSAWTLRAGDWLRRIQTGRAQDYVYGVAVGFLLLLIASQIWR